MQARGLFSDIPPINHVIAEYVVLRPPPSRLTLSLCHLPVLARRLIPPAGRPRRQAFCVSTSTTMRWILSRFNSDASQPEEPKPSVLTRHSADFSSPAEALRHYECPGVPPPPSSRVGDPKLKQRESEPLRIWHLWKYGAFAAMKGEFCSRCSSCFPHKISAALRGRAYSMATRSLFMGPG